MPLVLVFPLACLAARGAIRQRLGPLIAPPALLAPTPTAQAALQLVRAAYLAPISLAQVPRFALCVLLANSVRTLAPRLPPLAPAAAPAASVLLLELQGAAHVPLALLPLCQE